MPSHEPTSDTVYQKASALTRKTSVHVPVAVVASAMVWLAIAGWNHLDAAEAGIAENKRATANGQEQCIRLERIVERHDRELSTGKADMARIEQKIDNILENIKDLKGK